MRYNKKILNYILCKKIIIFYLFIFFYLILIGCNKKIENLISNDYKINYITLKGDFFLKKKKYSRALRLYEKALFKLNKEKKNKNEKENKNIIYKIAMINFYKKKYVTAAEQFKNFYLKYPEDNKAEEAFFYLGYCYYIISPDYNLDQNDTYVAIKQLQNFIDKYPESKRKSEVNNLIEELISKLEKKHFEIAKAYYDVTNYKSAIKLFTEFINDFPNSSLKQESKYYILSSQYKLIMKNFSSLRRKIYLKKILNIIKNYIKKYPNSLHKKEIEKIKKKILKNI